MSSLPLLVVLDGLAHGVVGQLVQVEAGVVEGVRQLLHHGAGGLLVLHGGRRPRSGGLGRRGLKRIELRDAALLVRSSHECVISLLPG